VLDNSFSLLEFEKVLDGELNVNRFDNIDSTSNLTADKKAANFHLDTISHTSNKSIKCEYYKDIMGRLGRREGCM